MSEAEGESAMSQAPTDGLHCDVKDCTKPALCRVFPTHGATDHSALRCRDCFEYDADRGWFEEWAEKIEARKG